MGASWWGTGTRMAFHRVRFDERGVDFRLGTRRNPQTQFFPWEQISTVSHRRQGNAHYYAVHGLDGRSATFSSYTFFRPRKVARMVAALAGQSIQEA